MPVIAEGLTSWTGLHHERACLWGGFHNCGGTILTGKIGPSWCMPIIVEKGSSLWLNASISRRPVTMENCLYFPQEGYYCGWRSETLSCWYHAKANWSSRPQGRSLNSYQVFSLQRACHVAHVSYGGIYVCNDYRLRACKSIISLRCYGWGGPLERTSAAWGWEALPFYFRRYGLHWLALLLLSNHSHFFHWTVKLYPRPPATVHDTVGT